jgi:hypothetical protein
MMASESFHAFFAFVGLWLSMTMLLPDCLARPTEIASGGLQKRQAKAQRSSSGRIFHARVESRLAAAINSQRVEDCPKWTLNVRKSAAASAGHEDRALTRGGVSRRARLRRTDRSYRGI